MVSSMPENEKPSPKDQKVVKEVANRKFYEETTDSFKGNSQRATGVTIKAEEPKI